MALQVASLAMDPKSNGLELLIFCFASEVNSVFRFFPRNLLGGGPFVLVGRLTRHFIASQKLSRGFPGWQMIVSQK